MPNAAKRLLTKRTQFSSDTADPRFVFSLSTLSFLFPRWPVIASNTRQSQKIQTKSSIYTLQPNFSLRVLAQGLFKSLSDPLTSHTRTMSPVPSWACTRSIKHHLCLGISLPHPTKRKAVGDIFVLCFVPSYCHYCQHVFSLLHFTYPPRV